MVRPSSDVHGGEALMIPLSFSRLAHLSIPDGSTYTPLHRHYASLSHRVNPSLQWRVIFSAKIVARGDVRLLAPARWDP